MLPESLSALPMDEKKYRKALARVLPLVIENDAEHGRLLAETEKLMDKGASRSREEDRLLKLLAPLIQEFEDRRYPVGDSSTPLSVLKTLMEQRGLAHKDVWRLFGSKGIASEVINGKREISKKHAKALAEFIRVPADLFL